MKLTFLIAVICATSASAQVWVRKCRDSGIKASVAEGLSVVNTLCQQAANRPIPAAGRIASCVPFQSSGATPEGSYNWDLIVRHNFPSGLGVPPRYSDPVQCVAAVTAALQQCGGGVLTQGGYSYYTSNIVEWEIDPNEENTC